MERGGLDSYHCLGFSLDSTKVYWRYKSKEEVKNNLIELKESKGSFQYEISVQIKKFDSPPSSPPCQKKIIVFDQKYKRIRMCQSSLLPLPADIICKRSLKVM